MSLAGPFVVRQRIPLSLIRGAGRPMAKDPWPLCSATAAMLLSLLMRAPVEAGHWFPPSRVVMPPYRVSSPTNEGTGMLM